MTARMALHPQLGLRQGLLAHVLLPLTISIVFINVDSVVKSR